LNGTSQLLFIFSHCERKNEQQKEDKVLLFDLAVAMLLCSLRTGDLHRIA
jgi:hypothetical protein